MDKILEFTGNHPLLALGLLVSFFVVIFTELRRKANGLVNIDPIDAVRLINNDAIILDLRGADTFSLGHIVNARNIPSDELDAKMASIEKHKSDTIVAVCDAGLTSTKVVNTLRTSGFENVFGLKGGMAGWSQAGLPVVGGKKTRGKDGKGKGKGKGKNKQKKAKKAEASQPKVTIYGNESCPYCGAARMLLTKKGVEFEGIAVTDSPELLAEMHEKSGRKTVPQIFIDETHIGGFDDLSALDQSGELDKLLGR